MAKRQEATTALVPFEKRELQLTCANCLAWRPNLMKDPDPFYGGCARSGSETNHYGEPVYRLYTTDMQRCTRWEPKKAQ